MSSLWTRLTLFFWLMNGLLFWNLWKSYISLGWERHRKTKIESTVLGCGKVLQKGQHDNFNLCVGEERFLYWYHMLPDALSCSCLPGKRLVRRSLVQNFLWSYFLHYKIPFVPDAPFLSRNPSFFLWKSCLWHFCGNEEIVFLSKMEIFLGRHWVALFSQKSYHLNLQAPHFAISFWHCSIIRKSACDLFDPSLHVSPIERINLGI